jgi:uncharacterized SAM-binding protein YcdF (DUF218 family)
MKGSFRKRWTIAILFLIFLSFSWLLRSVWLPFFGTFLVINDNLQKSDVVIVLGTDLEGAREAWAAQIYKRGLVKKILICGYHVGWKTSTAEIMKRHVLSLGIPEDAIILDYGWNNDGTWDNAINSLKIIRENNFRSAIVVTSNYHTRRARFAFTKLFEENGNVRILISACPGGSFKPGEWWKSRRIVKSVFLEYTKLIYYVLFPPDLAPKTEG